MEVNKKLEEQEHEGRNKSVNAVDRISQLPQHIIHDILGFLPTKNAAQTSILSKTWLQAWASFPNFDFDENYFEANESFHYCYSEEKNQAIRRNKDKFMNFIDDTLQRSLEHNLSIKKFRLCMGFRGLKLNMASHIDQWVSFAIEKNVKELDLQIDYYDWSLDILREKPMYNLPQIVFDSTTLTVLKLCCCNLMAYGDIRFSLLQKLYLERLYIDEHILENVTSSCCSIKDLRLKFCHGLKYLKISTLLQLNRIQVEMCNGLRQVKIGTRSLQTFQFDGMSICHQCEIDLKAGEILKELKFKDVDIKDQLLQDFSSKFPNLEVLVLDHCQCLKDIDISSQKLKRLVLRSLNLDVARIDTPNLIALESVHNVIRFYSIHTPKLREVELQSDTWDRYRCQSEYSLWYEELKVFLGKFANFNGLALVIQFNTTVIIHEDLRAIALPPLENFKNSKVFTKITSMNLSALLEKLTLDFTLHTLSVVSSSDSKLLKILYEEPRYSFVKHQRPADPTLFKLYEKMHYKISTFEVKTEKDDLTTQCINYFNSFYMRKCHTR